MSALVRAAHVGGPRAVDDLLAAVRPSLTAFFARRFPPVVAEDLAQTALIRIARATHRIEPERADRYLMTIARNVLRTEYRRWGRTVLRQVPLDQAVDVEAPERLDAEVEYRDLASAVQRASREALPPPLRDVVLALMHGLTPSEIAARQRLNPVTIRTRLLRARVMLRLELRPYLDAPAAAGVPRPARTARREVYLHSAGGAS